MHINESILIVDDDERILQTISRNLTLSGYTVFTTSDGTEAIHLYKQKRPDIVMTDIRMPNIDGFEILRRIRLHNAEAEIILITGHGDMDLAITALRTGASDFIPKPIEQATLDSALRHARERLRLKRELRKAHDQLEYNVQQRTAELSLANAQYEGLVNSIDGIVWEADAQASRFSFVSKQAEQLLGYPVSDWLTEHDFLDRHIHPTDREWAIELRQNSVLKNEDYECEYRMLTADRRQVWLKDIVTVIRENDQRIKLRGVMIDITERKRLEEHLDAIYNLGRNLTLLHDENTIMQRALETAAQVIRFECANFSLVEEATNELTQRYYWSDGVITKAARKLALADTSETLRNVVHGGQAVNIPNIAQAQCCLSNPDAPARFRSQLCVPMKIGDHVIGILSVESIDTGRFTADDQQLLQALANQTAVALENARLYTQAQRGTRELTALNNATHALTSNLDLNTVLKLTMVEINTLLQAEDASVLLLDAENDELVFAAVASSEAFATLFGKHIPANHGIAGWTVRNKQSVRVDNAQHDTRFYDGIDVLTGVTTQSLLAVPLISRGDVIGVIEVINKTGGVFDAHDLELLEALASSAAVAIDNARLYQKLVDQIQMLQETQDQLIHSEKMAALGRLVASISHEINNPLQSIQGCLTLADEELESDLRPDKLARYLSVAEDEIERIAAIVRRVRDFYRPSSHEQLNIDIHETLESVLVLSGKQLQHSNVDIQRIWAPSVPKIMANADHLKQVFLNLVLNAVDAMPDGGTLTIQTALNYDMVTIEFTDTGIGMSEETRARLFEPFFTTKPHGSGLGLSISYGIIEAHNGQISVTTAPGKGTTFTLSLPIEQP